jgi:hypothetical protein
MLHKLHRAGSRDKLHRAGSRVTNMEDGKLGIECPTPFCGVNIPSAGYQFL